MKRAIGYALLFAAMTLLAACKDKNEIPDQVKTDPVTEDPVTEDNATQTQSNNNQDSNQGVSQQTSEDSGDEFAPNYMYAVALNGLIEQQASPFVFDVRSKTSFDKSHITNAFSMPYGKTDDQKLAAVNGLAKDSSIVTYCGCPRHLSTLAAKDLTDRGYTNVSVLYEGYWHWKDNGYPVTEAQTTADNITHFRFDVSIAQSRAKALDGQDLFLRHRSSGQLEAARIVSGDALTVEFRVYDHQDRDSFDVYLADLNGPSILTVAPSTQSHADPNSPQVVEVSL